jgi:hypothetical protein
MKNFIGMSLLAASIAMMAGCHGGESASGCRRNNTGAGR